MDCLAALCFASLAGLSVNIGDTSAMCRSTCLHTPGWSKQELLQTSSMRDSTQAKQCDSDANIRHWPSASAVVYLHSKYLCISQTQASLLERIGCAHAQQVQPGWALKDNGVQCKCALHAAFLQRHVPLLEKRFACACSLKPQKQTKQT